MDYAREPTHLAKSMSPLDLQDETTNTIEGMPEKILIVDDEKPVVEGLTFSLRKEGYATIAAYDGEQALAKARNEKPDLIILDLMLPKVSGLEVCRALRRDSTIPILMLTAKGGETDKVVGFELGADDYVVKPFSTREVVSRVKALLRRASGPVEEDQRIEVGDVDIDLGRREVRARGKLVELAPKEFELLELLARRRGRAVRRDLILEQIWGPDFFGDERTLDVHIRRIREKIEKDPSRPKHVLTVRSFGYKLRD
jgi:DNA-binding response OmpR family regulator